MSKFETIVLIPVFDQSQFLPNAIDSVWADSVEILCIIDGMSDLYLRRIIEYYRQKNINKISFIYKENGGLSDTRNYGLKYVLNEKPHIKYICFLDSDDMFKPGSIDKMIEEIKSYPKSFIYPKIQMFGISKEYWNPLKEHNKFNHLYRNNIPYSILVPAEIFKEENVYYRKYPNIKEFSEDWRFSLELNELGWNAVLATDALLIYRTKKQSMATRTKKYLPNDFKRNKHELRKLYSPENVENLRVIELSKLELKHEEKNLSDYINNIEKNVKIQNQKYRVDHGLYIDLICTNNDIRYRYHTLLWSSLFARDSLTIHLTESNTEFRSIRKTTRINYKSRKENDKSTKIIHYAVDVDHEDNIKYKEWDNYPKNLAISKLSEKLVVRMRQRTIEEEKNDKYDILLCAIQDKIDLDSYFDQNIFLAFDLQSCIRILELASLKYSRLEISCTLLLLLCLNHPYLTFKCMQKNKSKIKMIANI